MPEKIQGVRSILSVLLICLLTTYVSGQSYPFAREFVPGVITLKDSTQKSGLVKWFPAQEEKLIFKENEKAPKQKFSPEELAGFRSDSFRFRSISGFEVYGNDYALLGKMSKINHTFGQLLDSGTVNIYLVLYSGYNALGGMNQSYPNMLFEKKTDSGYSYAAYPVAIRMKDKRYEKAKEALLSFFKEYPEISEKIKAYRQQDDFTEILNLVKKLN
jgi:hypothetical protein